MSAQIWEFWDHPPPVQACPHLVDHPTPTPPPVYANTSLALFETLQLVKNSSNRLREDTAPVNSGGRALCSNHWMDRGTLLQSILDN